MHLSNPLFGGLIGFLVAGGTFGLIFDSGQAANNSVVATFVGGNGQTNHPSSTSRGDPDDDQRGEGFDRVIGNISTQFGKIFQNRRCTVLTSWGGVIRGDKRFVPTFINSQGVAQAYCDRQTGLVWQARPPGLDSLFKWTDARHHCMGESEPWNGHLGGRLPSIPELSTLVDTGSDNCTIDQLCLPDGHPFQNVQSAKYWAATEDADESEHAWAVDISRGVPNVFSKDSLNMAWCVRGSMNADVY